MCFYQSKYNIFIEEKGLCYIYNLISGCLLKASRALFSFLRRNESKCKRIEPTQFDKGLLDSLILYKILYRESEQESDYMEFKHLKDKYDSSYLSMVIMPTLKCNLDCHYCYEKEKSKNLTDEQFDMLKLFFQKQSKQNKFMVVRWSGGEFLTMWKKVRELSIFIIQQCKLNNCIFEASAITNGTLMTSKIVDEMYGCNIKSIQITLDGAKDMHDKVRYTRNGKGTFDDIVSAIEIASQKIKVLIRINVDKNNFSSMESLFSSLARSGINRRKIQLFCKPVLCSLARIPRTHLFSHKEFYDVEMHLLELSEKYGLPYAFHWGTQAVKNIRCSYNNMEGFYVNPDMNLYKCPLYVDCDEAHSIGYISTEGNCVINNYEEYLKCLSYSPFKETECLNCKVLPICHGKCPVLWEQSGRLNDEGCIPEKHSIEEKIRYALRNPEQMLSLQNNGLL